MYRGQYDFESENILVTFGEKDLQSVLYELHSQKTANRGKAMYRLYILRCSCLVVHDMEGGNENKSQTNCGACNF